MALHSTSFLKGEKTMTDEGMKERLKQVHAELREKKMNPELLAVAMLPGGTNVIGEVAMGPEVHVGEALKMKNPKRFLALTGRTPGSSEVKVEFMVGDLDMIEFGTVELLPVGFYRFTDLGVESQLALLELFLDFHQRKAINRAREAGIVAPVRPQLR